MATMRDVAAAAGVSTATVSRVVNQSGVVDPELTARVRAAISELGYRPNLVARGLRNQTTTVLALVFSDIENPFFTSVCRGVEDTARRHGYSVLLCNADENIEKEASYVNILASQSVAGVIISPASDETDIEPLVGQGVAIVALDRRLVHHPTDSVHSDSRAGARNATRHLLESGAHRVGCITGPRGVSTAEERLGGYRDAISAARLPDDPTLCEYANFREDGGYRAAKRMLELPEPPDALFVANNRMLAGALRACIEAGVAIPDEVSIVGFDDLPWADFTQPSITTVRQPTYEIGAAAARLLIERIAGADLPPREIVFQPELVVRGSSVKRASSARSDTRTRPASVSAR